MKKLICILLLLALALSLVACGEKEADTFPIETPYGTLHYPAKWSDCVRTEINDNAVAFYGSVEGRGEQPLFTLQFEQGDGFYLGTFRDTTVYIVDGEPLFDTTWTDVDKEQIYAMQEDVNVILKDFELREGTAQPEPTVVETYSVESPIGELPYPEKWREQVRVEQTEDTLAFYANIGAHPELLLFTLEFGDGEGFLLGTLSGKSVYVLDNVPEFDETWTDEEKATVSAMQEDLDVIVQDLIARDTFILNG